MNKRRVFLAAAATVALAVNCPAALAAETPANRREGCAVTGATAAQVLLVTATGSTASVQACERVHGRTTYRRVHAFDGYVGRNGVSAAKREGDGATPAGAFPLRGGFGVAADPGVPGGYFQVDHNDVWVDDAQRFPHAYNTHQRRPDYDGESLYSLPAYRYAQVIGYNERRVPGAGSAIFLHVSTGRPTAGCVSLAEPDLLTVFRWQRPGAVIVIR